MLKWSRHLYLGRNVKKHEERIRQRLNDGRMDVGHYLITFAANENDELDIVSTVKLTAYDRKYLPTIVGMAGTRQEAYDLIVEMTNDCLRDTGDVHLRTYLNSINRE